MYQVLHYIKENNLNCKAGFIHIPFTNEQVVDKPKAAFVPVEHIAKRITKAIEVIIEHK